MAFTRTPFFLWSPEKKIPWFSWSVSFLWVWVLASPCCCSCVLCCLVLSCVVLCCLVSLFDLTGSVKSSGRRRVFGQVVFLCCFCFFITSSSGSFLGAYTVRPSPHLRCSPWKGLQSWGFFLCRNPLGDRQVLKGVTQPNVTILGGRGSIGDDRYTPVYVVYNSRLLWVLSYNIVLIFWSKEGKL